MIRKKLNEEPRSLLLNERCLYSVFFKKWQTQFTQKKKNQNIFFSSFSQHNSRNWFPANQRSQKGSQNFIKETVYQRPLNSAGWNYGGEKRRESTFNFETKNVFGILQKDHKSSSNRLSNNAETPVLDQATYGKNFTIKMSAEQSYSTLHFKLDLFQLQLRNRRRKQKHEHSQTFGRKTFWLRWAEELKNGRCKMHQRHLLETWLQQVLISSNTAWKTKWFFGYGRLNKFFRNIRLIIRCSFYTDDIKQVFRISLHFF